MESLCSSHFQPFRSQRTRSARIVTLAICLTVSMVGANADDGETKTASCLAFSADGTHVAVGTVKGVTIVNIQTGDVDSIPIGSGHGILAVKFARDAGCIVAADGDGGADLWSVAMDNVLPGPRTPTPDVSVSCAGFIGVEQKQQSLCVASRLGANMFALFDHDTGKRKLTFARPIEDDYFVDFLALSEDAKTVAAELQRVRAGVPDGLIALWDVEGRRRLHTLRGHREWVEALRESG